jgi:TRAP-type transport system periplasmic protein
MNRLTTSIAAAGLVFLFATSAAFAQVRLNLATLAPEGSIWMQALNDAKAEVETATGNAVRIRIYPGGIMGSEKDVLAKIRMGQLHGGGFLGYAVGLICPDASVVMSPLALRNAAEADAAMDGMRSFLDDQTRKNGFEVLGWTEVGFNYAYGTKPISNLEELRATKVWGLDSPMLNELFAACGIASIPVNVTDVLTSLQTGALETVFGPPTAAVAVQWHTRVRYYNEMNLGYTIGGVFLSAAGWKSIPPQHQAVVKAAFDKHCRLLTPKVRKSDAEALQFMRAQGVQPIPETPQARVEFERVAQIATDKVMGKSFSVEAWNLLQGILAPLRAP